MKKLLQIYANMGDYARAIDIVEDKIKHKNFANMRGVGGAVIKSEKDARYMIDLQWARIKTLEDVIKKTEKESLSYVQYLKGSMCKDCIMNVDTVVKGESTLPRTACQKDYAKMTLYKTILEVIQ